MAFISNFLIAGERQNIAYTDDYIWYLARGMADRRMDISFSNGIDPESDYQIRSDTALLYHHYLISCDGPLDDLEKILTHLSTSDPRYFLGISGDEAQRILARWEAKFLPLLAELMASGRISSELPSCVNKNYVAPTIDE
jgi:hypothetical protein